MIELWYEGTNKSFRFMGLLFRHSVSLSGGRQQTSTAADLLPQKAEPKAHAPNLNRGGRQQTSTAADLLPQKAEPKAHAPNLNRGGRQQTSTAADLLPKKAEPKAHAPNLNRGYGCKGQASTFQQKEGINLQ